MSGDIFELRRAPAATCRAAGLREFLGHYVLNHSDVWRSVVIREDCVVVTDTATNGDLLTHDYAPPPYSPGYGLVVHPTIEVPTGAGATRFLSG